MKSLTYYSSQNLPSPHALTQTNETLPPQAANPPLPFQEKGLDTVLSTVPSVLTTAPACLLLQGLTCTAGTKSIPPWGEEHAEGLGFPSPVFKPLHQLRA